jgi:hypothetical protein
MPYALHQQDIADGKITLYQSDDVKDGIWQCRMVIKGNRGYVRRSTGETSLEKAKVVSLQILGEFKQRKAQNLPMTRKTFAEIVAGNFRDEQRRERGSWSASPTPSAILTDSNRGAIKLTQMTSYSAMRMACPLKTGRGSQPY